MTVNSFDKLEYGYLYRALIHSPPVPLYRVDLFGWEWKVEYQLRLSGVLSFWERAEKANCQYLYYQLYRREDITHGEVFEWIMYCYDRASCLVREQLAYSPESIPEYIKIYQSLWTLIKAFWYIPAFVLLLFLLFPFVKTEIK